MQYITAASGNGVPIAGALFEGGWGAVAPQEKEKKRKRKKRKKEKIKKKERKKGIMNHVKILHYKL